MKLQFEDGGIVEITRAAKGELRMTVAPSPSAGQIILTDQEAKVLAAAISEFSEEF